jgi:hypothetical protein
MLKYEHLITQPVFFLFVAFSFLLTLGYFWGRRQNRDIYLSALDDLVKIVKPDDQTFTNIGGAIGYHANLQIKKKGAPISRVDATITLLPRHSWLYLPISKLIRRYDRLFITVHMKHPLPEEVHLIEDRYDGFRKSKITNADRLNREDITWGNLNFHFYYGSTKMRDKVMKFMESHPEPGTIRHIALVPEQKSGFIFMIPKKDGVARYLKPVYDYIPRLINS